jgi:hypothetical protein
MGLSTRNARGEPAPRRFQIVRSMPRRHHVLKSLPGGIPVSMLARDTNPALACCAVPRAILLGMDIEQRREINGAVFEIVGMHIDH